MCIRAEKIIQATRAIAGQLCAWAAMMHVEAVAAIVLIRVVQSAAAAVAAIFALSHKGSTGAASLVCFP